MSRKELNKSGFWVRMVPGMFGYLDKWSESRLHITSVDPGDGGHSQAFTTEGGSKMLATQLGPQHDITIDVIKPVISSLESTRGT